MASPNEKLRVLRRIPEIRFDEEMRGYNKNQVDRVLENLAPLADEVDVLLDRLNEAERRAATAEAKLVDRSGPPSAADPMPVAAAAPIIAPADFDETLSKTLLLAQRTADTTVNEANEQAIRIRTSAEAEAAAARDKAASDSAQARQEIERDRGDVIRQANAEASTMVDAARSTIDAKIRAAEQELVDAHEATRAGLLEQIAELQRTRDALAVDVDHFEGHLAARRETIREALAELSTVIDDPDRLRTTMPPTPISVADHDPAAYPPIKVEVTTLDTLAAEVEVEGANGLGDAIADEADETDAGYNEADAGASTFSDAGSAGVLWADSQPEADDGASSEDEAGSAHDDSADDGPDDVGPDADDGDPTAAFSILDTDAVETDDPEADSRPDWADAVPVIDDSEAPDDESDPFLDELRRVTSDDDDDDEALSSFLSESDEGDSKGGWFGRRK